MLVIFIENTLITWKMIQQNKYLFKNNSFFLIFDRQNWLKKKQINMYTNYFYLYMPNTFAYF